MSNNKPNLYDVYSRLGKIEGKLDASLKRIENHETRINDVEKTQDKLVGKISIFGSIAGFVGGIILSIISYFMKK